MAEKGSGREYEVVDHPGFFAVYQVDIDVKGRRSRGARVYSSRHREAAEEFVKHGGGIDGVRLAGKAQRRLSGLQAAKTTGSDDIGLKPDSLARKPVADEVDQG